MSIKIFILAVFDILIIKKIILGSIFQQHFYNLF